MIPREFKGKARANTQTEGNGGADGIVLPLTVVGSGVYDVAYSIEASVGAGGQKLFLQVDTGSSDLWIASKSCSSSPCGQTSGHLYDPSSSTPTGENFNINYLRGTVSGPIVWDKFEIGGYSLDSQALAAATTITDEHLSASFSGILGLALPLNSIIASLIPPVTSNKPDGAAWASNLFSITPAPSAPSARFLSLLLSRPDSDAVPAQLAIGRHPAFVADPAAVQYAALESETQGTLFWKVGVRAITVWVAGVGRMVELGTSSSGGVVPSAVLDTGVPLILTTSTIANGIYGAIGVGPGSDGQYYVPCTTPLNLTITLDDRRPIPLHPLDLTSNPTSNSNSNTCIGLIQTADAVLARPDAPGDIILGVPFLRNTYTVLAYEPPDGRGGFDPSTSVVGDIRPRLGMLGITDPGRAMDEFNTVRVLNQPLSSTSGSSSSSSSSSNSNSNSNPNSNSDGGGDKRLSVGLIVLVSLVGFFVLCIGMFGVRWWVARRRFGRRGGGAEASLAGSRSGSGVVLPGIGRATATASEREREREREREKEKGGYAYARASTRGSRDLGKVQPGKELYDDEETMRSKRWEPYMQDHGLVDLGLGLGEPTKVVHEEHREGDGEHEEHHDGEGEGEMGVRDRRDRRDRRRDEHEHEHGDEDEAWGEGDDTLVGAREVRHGRGHESTQSTVVPLLRREISYKHDPARARARVSSGGGASLGALGRGGGGVDEFGVVEHEHGHGHGRRGEYGYGYGYGAEEGAGAGKGERRSMVGVGTAAAAAAAARGGMGWRDSSASGWRESRGSVGAGVGEGVGEGVGGR